MVMYGFTAYMNEYDVAFGVNVHATLLFDRSSYRITAYSEIVIKSLVTNGSLQRNFNFTWLATLKCIPVRLSSCLRASLALSSSKSFAQVRKCVSALVACVLDE
jgi:hypothetical protein